MTMHDDIVNRFFTVKVPLIATYSEKELKTEQAKFMFTEFTVNVNNAPTLYTTNTIGIAEIVSDGYEVSMVNKSDIYEVYRIAQNLLEYDMKYRGDRGYSEEEISKMTMLEFLAASLWEVLVRNHKFDEEMKQNNSTISKPTILGFQSRFKPQVHNEIMVKEEEKKYNRISWRQRR